MTIERKTATFTVEKTTPSGVTYDDMLAEAWDTAVSGVGAGDWATIFVEKRGGSTYKDSYIIWLEKVS